MQYANNENATVAFGVEDGVRSVLEAPQSRSEALCKASQARVFREIAKARFIEPELAAAHVRESDWPAGWRSRAEGEDEPRGCRCVIKCERLVFLDSLLYEQRRRGEGQHAFAATPVALPPTDSSAGPCP